ncbi:outer membrane protein assembly factor BamB family protein [Sphingobacterium hungaricum]|uniref:Metallophosphoesterase n=1 Tax=Sphingobacterium hungaricum TaxID=2082723 RepID=A0A928UTK3_9SPHI|nr:PQQ-binding-like beta-propeller repeat protein [Sphingobacterium hungaricum]MBE8713086.1 metallophosphoesterase [Sphingobacterium hungaricum]
MKNLFSILFIVIFSYSLSAQTFKFALVTDTHVGGSTGADDLRRTVADLNKQNDIDFVILSGDVTEFGSDEELRLAKQILDSLRLPLHVIPGNHDSNWSESGANTFKKTFGAETFSFAHKGYLFLGNASGPNLRMGPGQIPREHLVWMDSVFAANPNVETPVIFINHYPLDSSLNNWYDAIAKLKTRNIQLSLCGHGHSNRLYDWEGIPGVMNRSNLRAKEEVGGYNIITIDGTSASFRVRKPRQEMQGPWLTVALKNHYFSNDTAKYPRPSYAVNENFLKHANIEWTFQDNSDLIAGISSESNLFFTSNTVGEVYALNAKTGNQVWKFLTGGKIYSTPAVGKNTVVVGSSDGYIYGIHAKTGKELWKVKTDKAVLGSPSIEKDIAYIGSSDGIFRAIDVHSGKVLWQFDKVNGFVSTKPTLYKDKVLFGSWENGFYALDKTNGNLIWEWNNGHANRMFSAAACYPVAVNDRIFIVAPDRFMTCLDANTGKVIWREKKDPYRVRESMGLSADGTLVYVKTMDGELLGISTAADTMEIAFTSTLKLPYEISPTAISADKNLVLVPNNNGLLSAVDAKTGEVAWQYKISNGLINPLYFNGKTIVVSAMDGKVSKLKIK